MNWDWMKSVQWLANVGHFLAGLSVILVAWTLTHATTPLLIVSVLFLLYALIKEYWFDLMYETGETLWSSTEDFLGYVLGYGAGCGVIIAAHYFS